VEHVKKILAEIGLQPERVRMFNMSSAMAGGFVDAASEMTEKITELGPNPLRNHQSQPADNQQPITDNL
jgi:coenzyme F420-reducing hydrogenase delta subunit